MKNYKANFNYFDVIDTPNKAYWLGFLFADGYIAKRIRKTNAGNERIEYNLKISVKDDDNEILIKLAKDLESNYPIHYYDVKSSFGDLKEARLFITNKYMVEKLYNEYGIVPNRTSIQKIVERLPENLYRYFILGLFDGDGSFSFYLVRDNRRVNKRRKMILRFGGSEEVLRFIESILIKEQLVAPLQRQLERRHKDGDGTWRCLTFSGMNNCTQILNWLYQDSPIYLERKYQKYLNILKEINNK